VSSTVALACSPTTLSRNLVSSVFSHCTKKETVITRDICTHLVAKGPPPVGASPAAAAAAAAAPAPTPTPAPAALSSSSSARRAKVTFDYTANDADELSLRVGDIVVVISEESEGWWKAELNGRQGMMPSNFAEIVEGSFFLHPSPFI